MIVRGAAGTTGAMPPRPPTLVASAMAPVVAVLRNAGGGTSIIARAVWDEPGRRVPARASDALWVTAQRRVGEDLPLRIAAGVQPSTYGHLTYLLAAAPDVGAALRLLARRYGLLGDTTAHHVECRGKAARVIVELRGGPRPPCVETFAVAVVLAFLRRQTAGRLVATRVSLAQDAPHRTSRDRCSASLGAAVEYGATWCGFELDRSALDLPLDGAAPELLRLLEAHADHLAARGEDGDVVRRVADRIAARGPRVGLGAAVIAADLGWSERTLRRRLAGAATSFQAVLDVALHDAALARLGHEGVPEVAHALGYADAGSFRRAHRRWIGAPPSGALGVRHVQHERGVDDVGVVDVE